MVERSPVKRVVGGSSPLSPVKYLRNEMIKISFFLTIIAVIIAYCMVGFIIGIINSYVDRTISDGPLLLIGCFFATVLWPLIILHWLNLLFKKLIPYWKW